MLEDHLIFHGTELERLLTTYESLVSAGLVLYNTLDEMLKKQSAEDPSVYGLPGARAEYDREKELLRFVIPEVPPKIRKTSWKTWRQVYEHWRNMIIYAYRYAGLEVSFDRAFCLFYIYLPREGTWDLDAREAVTPVFNAMRLLGIIEDDGWEQLTYMVMGKPDKRHPRTEVHVMDARQILTFMINIGIQI